MFKSLCAIADAMVPSRTGMAIRLDRRLDRLQSTNPYSYRNFGQATTAACGVEGQAETSLGTGISPPSPPHPLNPNSDRNGQENETLDDDDDDDPNQTVPDTDHIKMFVGQIPREMAEGELTHLLKPFGRIYHINVLRDKRTGQSKNCCFITYFKRKAALRAQNSLHNVLVLPGMHHPVQMKPADIESRTERKLFVGMISKSCTEETIRGMFSRFGALEECTVLRDTNGQSKSCAFVTFMSKQSALSAIKTLHHSTTMEGCASPIVVKFADTQKEKDQKKMQQMQADLMTSFAAASFSQSYLGASLTAPPIPAPVAAVAAAAVAAAAMPDLRQVPPTLGVPGGLQGPNGFLLQNQHPGSVLNGGAGQHLDFNAAMNFQNLNAVANLTGMPVMPSASGSYPNLAMQTYAQLLMGNQNNVYGNLSLGINGAGSYANLPNLVNPSVPIPVQNLMSLAALNGVSVPAPSVIPGFVQSIPNPNVSPLDEVAGKNTRGPEGANLFLYFLPEEITSSDLVTLFSPYGKLLSAKVYVEKFTGRSKCYGFVSYDSTASAEKAVKCMHQRPIGSKRISVTLKRPKNQNSTYQNFSSEFKSLGYVPIRENE